MVMPPGRYALRDHARAGLPVAMVFLVVAMLALPVVLPLRAAGGSPV